MSVPVSVPVPVSHVEALFGSGLCPPGARARAGARPVFSIVKAFRVRPTKMFELSDFPMLLCRGRARARTCTHGPKWLNNRKYRDKMREFS